MESDDDLDEATLELLQADYQIGHFIRERIVPHAVLYFTGEACDVSTVHCAGESGWHCTLRAQPSPTSANKSLAITKGGEQLFRTTVLNVIVGLVIDYHIALVRESYDSGNQIA